MNLFPNQPAQSILTQDLAKLTQLNQFNQYQLSQSQPSILDDVRRKLNDLTKDELAMLTSYEQFNSAFTMYQTRLHEYVLNRFAEEYTQTERGRSDITNVGKAIDANIELVRSQARKTQEELAQLAQLLKEEPGLLEKLKK